MSPIDQVAALRRHLETREVRILELFNETQQLGIQIAAARRHNGDLLASNNRYLERARTAEERVKALDHDLWERGIENSALAALHERAVLAKHPDIVADVQAFHKGCETVDPVHPIIPDQRRKDLRVKLITEEVVNELLPAIEADNLVEIADAIADSIYVLIGTALAYGIPFWVVWREVQRSNMSKFDPVTGRPVRREDGKILKGPHFVAPDIETIILGAAADGLYRSAA